jgi:hypothetical protein
VGAARRRAEAGAFAPEDQISPLDPRAVFRREIATTRGVARPADRAELTRRDYAAVRQALAHAGYNGEKIVVVAPTGSERCPWLAAILGKKPRAVATGTPALQYCATTG